MKLCLGGSVRAVGMWIGGLNPRAGGCVDGGSCSGGLKVWSKRPQYGLCHMSQLQCRTIGVVRGLQGVLWGCRRTLYCRAESNTGGSLYRAVSVCVEVGAEEMVWALSPSTG